MTSTETPDTNGDRYCNQRWNHRDEVTVVIDDMEWCPVCAPTPPEELLPI
jgi:hypothetical protein